jgi:hypothetical protein
VRAEVSKSGKQHVMQKQIRVFYIFIIFALEKLSKFQGCTDKILPLNNAIIHHPRHSPRSYPATVQPLDPSGGLQPPEVYG